MPVAKSYQGLATFGEPFQENKKAYVVVITPTGAHKKVRFYSDAEYARMYPEKEPIVKKIRSTKEVLGFSKGYITIFKGNTYPVLEWFQQEPRCRYHNFWGWYVVSEEEVPENLPAGIEPVQLKWEDVAIVEEDTLKSQTLVRQVVNALIYEPSSSRYQGEVGERLDLVVTITKVVTLENGYYGTNVFHLMEDADGNEYCWTTATCALVYGKCYSLRGTVKAHQNYKGKEQTVLTRCNIK